MIDQPCYLFDWLVPEDIQDKAKFLDISIKFSENGNWVFRGIPRWYSLETRLERVFNNVNVLPTKRPERERQLIQEFKRRAHHYLNLLPGNDDITGWLALMQHYGAPTRLLDWTYSFFIASYFALSDADSKEKSELPSNDKSREDCYVIAIKCDDLKLEKQSAQAYESYRIGSKKIPYPVDFLCADTDHVQNGINAFLWDVMETPKKCVWSINSFRLNERQSVQQGVFLCPGDITYSFIDNLQVGNPSPENLKLFKLSTERNTRTDILRLLYRMNINHTSLFPGLSGFAESLRHKLWIPETLRPKDPQNL